MSDGRTDSFSPSILSSSRNLFILGTSTTITPSETQKVFPIPAWRKYSTGSSLLTSFPSTTLTYPLFYIASLAVGPALTFSLLPPLSPSPAPGRCFRTWVPTTYQFFYLSLSLRSFAPTSVPLSSTFIKLAGMTLLFILTLTVLLQWNTRLFLFPLLLLTSLLWHCMRPNLPFLSAALNALPKPGDPLKWKMRLVKDATLSLPLTEVMKIIKLTSSLPEALRLSSPRPKQLALLSRLNLTLNLYILFFTLLLAPPPLLTSPNCSSPTESDFVFADYLRSHFSVSQPKVLRSRARGYLSELRRATCPEEFHLFFCSPFSHAKFLAAASNLSLSSATGPNKVAYFMLKHLPRSGMDFLLHIFNLSWSLHSFPFIWKPFSIILIHKMGKPLDSSASYRHISLTSCVSKLFECIILSRLLFFVESNSILSPRQAGFRPGRSTLHQIMFLSRSISDEFNKPRPGSRTILSTIDFSKAFDSSGIPSFTINSFRLASLLALLVGLNLFFLTGALA